MSAKFVNVDRDTALLLPPDMRTWVPADHLVHFILDAVEQLDLRAARHFVLERSLLTVYLEVTNATNRRNECCVEYEFNTEEGEPDLELETTPYLTVIPNLGLVWEF